MNPGGFFRFGHPTGNFETKKSRHLMIPAFFILPEPHSPENIGFPFTLLFACFFVFKRCRFRRFEITSWGRSSRPALCVFLIAHTAFSILS